MKIAILGAESTGKTQLAQSLAAHWTQQGHSALWVPEVLREWCEREGRTPLAHEQLAICQEQAQRVLQAPITDWLVADTTPVMTAIYSDMLFDDASLYDFALAHQRHYDLTLVMALDLPWVADGLQRDGPHVREPVDRLLRAALARGALPYTVIGGQGAQRTLAALEAISAASMQR
jgi:nicotinamide riboside kinase